MCWPSRPLYRSIVLTTTRSSVIFLFLGTHLDDYVLVGCFADSQSLRIMFNKQSEDTMSASVSGTVYVCCVHLSTVYIHIGQCANECWVLGRIPEREGIEDEER